MLIYLSVSIWTFNLVEIRKQKMHISRAPEMSSCILLFYYFFVSLDTLCLRKDCSIGKNQQFVVKILCKLLLTMKYRKEGSNYHLHARFEETWLYLHTIFIVNPVSLRKNLLFSLLIGRYGIFFYRLIFIKPHETKTHHFNIFYL